MEPAARPARRQRGRARPRGLSRHDRPDGRPHAAGIGALWHDGRPLLHQRAWHPQIAQPGGEPGLHDLVRLEGIDLVLEGEGDQVTDRPTLERVAALAREGGWPAQVEGDAFTAPYSAPSAGPPPWHLYRLTVRTAFGVATAEPHGATRWRFDR